MKAKNPTTTLCERRFALVPFNCRACSKLIWFEWFYKVPWYTMFQLGTELPQVFSCQDQHCEACHNQEIKKLGHCIHCQAVTLAKLREENKEPITLLGG